MEREPEVAVCYGADPIRGGSYLHAGARSSPAAERAEGVQKAVLRDVLSTIRMLNWTPGHRVLARTPPFTIGSVLPAGPVHSAGASWDSTGHEGAYACRVAAHSQRRWDVDVRRGYLEANGVECVVHLSETPCAAMFDECSATTCCDRVSGLADACHIST